MPTPEEISAHLDDVLSQFPNVPRPIAERLIGVESRGDPLAVSPVGAKGLMQLMPAAAREMGVADPLDWKSNIAGGVGYLSKQIDRFGSVDRGLAAYHTGPGNVQKNLDAGGNGIPDNTDGIMRTPDYVRRIAGADTESRGRRLLPEAGAGLSKAVQQLPSDDPYAKWETLTPIHNTATAPAEKPGLWGVTKNLLWGGVDATAQDFRETTRAVLGDDVIEGIDKLGAALGMPHVDDVAKKHQDALPAEWQAASTKEWIDEAAGDAGGITDYIGPAWSDWRSYYSNIVGSIPGNAAMMIPAIRLGTVAGEWATKKALAKGLTAEAADTAGNRAAATAAHISGALIEGADQGGQSARQVYEEVKAMPKELLAQSDAFKALIASGLTPDEAQEQLARDLRTQVYIPSAVATGIFSGLGDRALTNIIRGRIRGRWRSAGLEAGSEGAEELFQNYLSTIAENVTKQQADPTIPTTQGALNQAVGGVIGGAAMGGGMGAAFHHAGPAEKQTPFVPPQAPGTQAPPAGASPAPTSEAPPVETPAAPVEPAQPVAAAPPAAQDIGRASDGKPFANARAATFARAKRDLTDTHEVVAVGPDQYVIRPKAETPTIPNEAKTPASEDIAPSADTAIANSEASAAPEDLSALHRTAQRDLDVQRDHAHPERNEPPSDEAVQMALRREARAENSLPAQTEAQDETPATKEQVLAGNAPLDHRKLGPFDISMENRVGTTRRDLHNEPPKWQTTMKADYGYAKGTVGHDKDHLDFYVKAGTPDDYSGPVYVVDQNKPGNGHFDEHKVMTGWLNKTAATKAYNAHYEAGWQGLQAITATTLAEVKAWSDAGGPKQGAFAEWKASTKPKAEPAARSAKPSSKQFEPGERVEWNNPSTHEEYAGRWSGTVVKQGEHSFTIKIEESPGGKANGKTMDFPPPRTPAGFSFKRMATIAASAAEPTQSPPAEKPRERVAPVTDAGIQNARTLKRTFRRIGIDIKERSDVTGERGKGLLKTGVMPGTFRKGGQSLDHWGLQLVEDGWLAPESQSEAGNENIRASMEDVRDFMRRVFNGEAVFKQGDTTAMQAQAEEVAADDLTPDDVVAVIADLTSGFPAEDVVAAFDLDAAARAAGITDAGIIEDIAERAAVRAESGESYEQAARAEIESRKDQAGAASDQQAAPGEGFNLEGQSPAEVAAAEDKAKADAEAKAEAERTAAAKDVADRDRGTFTLAGSDRPADVQAAQGQGDLLAAAAVEAQAEAIEPAPRNPAVDVETTGKGESIADFGEKIGGARKDTAKPLGSRGTITRDVDDRPAWARPYIAMEQTTRRSGYSFPMRNEPAPTKTGKWELMRANRGTSGAVTRASRTVFDTEEQALAAIPLAEVARLHRVYSYKDKAGEQKHGIFRQIGDRKRALVKGGFASEEDAMKAMATDPVSIIEHKFEFPEKPWLDHIERVGESRRKGDVTPKMFQDEFGFRAGEFGNWNMGSDGQAALNHAYDALHDLADAIGVPPKALSLNGELAIAFGARGTGGKGSAAAHYEPDKVVINLTKIKGAGSLAHEWFHALDDYLARSTDDAAATRARKMLGHRQMATYRLTGSARPELVAAFKHVVDTMTAKREGVAVDENSAKRGLSRAEEALKSRLDGLRSTIAKDREYGSKKRAASPRQLTEWDALAERAMKGDSGAAVDVPPPKGASRHAFGYQSSEVVRNLNAIFKAVTGRSFDRADQDSDGRRLFWSINSIADLNKRVAAAQEGAIEERKSGTHFLDEAKRIDDFRASAYWSTPHEMGARAFESYIFDKLTAAGEKSDYLVHAVENKYYALLDMKPYPEGEERAAIDKAFDGLFDVIQSKETDKGVALHEPGEAYNGAEPTQPDLFSDPYESLETRPGTIDAQKDDGRAALAAAERRIFGPAHSGLRGAASLLGSRISKDFRNEGDVTLVGQEVSSAHDLATIAQVVRDPRFETFRVFYVDSTDRIIGESVYSSRLPGAVHLPSDITDQIAADKKRFGKDHFGGVRYWLLHNHPSGLAAASHGDRVLTEHLKQEVPGFVGHVVIDHDEFHQILADGTDQTVPAPELKSKALADSNTEAPHALLGRPITGPSTLVAIGKEIQTRDGYVTVIATGGPKGKIGLITEIPVSALQGKTRPEKTRLLASMRRAMRQTGAGGYLFAVTPTDARGPEYALLRESGVFGDIVSAGAENTLAARAEMSAGRVPQTKSHRAGGKALPAWYAKEEASSYSPDEPAGEEAPGDVSVGDPSAAKKFVDSSLKSTRPYLLGALTRRQITEIYAKESPEIAEYDQAMQDMESDYQRHARASDVILRDWMKLKTPVADKMAEVMHAATLAEWDPAENVGKEVEAAKFRVLQRDYAALPEDAKSVYKRAREHYTTLLEDRFEALRSRIQRSDASPESKATVIAQLAALYDQAKAGVYFPLARFGDHIVIATKNAVQGRAADRTVQAFESPFKADQAARELRAQGWTVKQVRQKEYSREQQGAASKIVGDMMSAIDGLDTGIGESAVSSDIASAKDQLLDALNQSFIRSLPDMSYRRHFVHRKGTPGFSRDAMRAFADSAFHAAHHISRLRHGDELAFAIMGLDKRITELTEGDATAQRDVYNEMVKRHNQYMNPNTHPMAAWLGQLGFVMSLGGSVATGITNLTQVPLITLPWLGARYGLGRSSAALAKAYVDYADPKTLNKDTLFNAANSARLSDGERAMLRHLIDDGVIDTTQALDLAQLSSQDSTSRFAKEYGGTKDRIMRALAFTFNVPEVANRQVTALATYRLAKSGGASEVDAIRAAKDAIWGTHFDYSSTNRARYMSGNVMRVLTMFKQYSQNVVYLYGRALKVWLDKNGATKEERAIARKQLLTMLGFQFAAAGALGMPFVGAVASLFAAALNGLGDDDEKWDWEVEFRKWLAQAVGKEAGELVAHGLSRLTPWDMASRLGQNDLFFRAPNREREGRAAAMDWATALAGPVAGYGVNAWLGLEDLAKGVREGNSGHLLRGTEELMPAFARNLVKTTRLEVEGGLRTRDQHKQLDLSDTEILGQLFGFGSGRAAEMYEGITAIKNKEARVQGRRDELLDTFAAAVRDKNTEKRADVMSDIKEFNQRNPELKITAQTLNSSMRGRAKREAGMKDGLYLPKKREPLRKEGEFANL